MNPSAGFYVCGETVVLASRKTTKIAFPTITAAEIKDTGRGDFVSKAIALLQTTWFIVQCVARGVESIALTELELVTLALATLNWLMYYFWWDKPLGVKEPVRVYTVDMAPPKIDVDGEERLVSLTLDNVQYVKFMCKYSDSTRLLRKLPPFVQRLFLTPLKRLRSLAQHIIFAWHVAFHLFLLVIDYSASLQPLSRHYSATQSQFPGDKYLWFIYLPIYWFVILPFLFLFFSLMSIVDTDTIFSHNESMFPLSMLLEPARITCFS